MDSTSQLLILASAANAFLCGRFSVEGFYPSHPAFTHCDQVNFVRVKRYLLFFRREVQLAATPNEWLLLIRDAGARRVWVRQSPSSGSPLPDHISVAFVGGGGSWQLLVEYPFACEVWVARWQIIHSKLAHQRGCTVTYDCQRGSRRFPNLGAPDLVCLAERFRSILVRAADFASRHGAVPFASIFRHGLTILGNPTEIDFPDHVEFVCLDCYPMLAQQLLAASYASWVFGGMGSWNDLDLGEEYKQLSVELYAVLHEAMEGALNAFRCPSVDSGAVPSLG